MNHTWSSSLWPPFWEASWISEQALQPEFLHSSEQQLCGVSLRNLKASLSVQWQNENGKIRICKVTWDILWRVKITNGNWAKKGSLDYVRGRFLDSADRSIVNLKADGSSTIQSILTEVIVIVFWLPLILFMISESSSIRTKLVALQNTRPAALSF